MKKQNYIMTIKVLTGLHIGIGSDRPEIGGIDNPVIKDPNSKSPYIPGSSIKGKLRCLLETECERYDGEKDQYIIRNFGGNSESPTRLIFRDLKLSSVYQSMFDSNEIQTEIKTEIKIDRQKGTATAGALRTIERVPPATLFVGEVLVRYEDDSDLRDIKEMLDESINLLNNDYLGGSGSRGYGAVDVKLTEKE
ncbi:MAG: type III-A CRISPR-associated RAMP protein Csm3 [Melioribacteraceae bacterium]|nr:type III-A CRISPR-associated RAMP protein Csm3 [Melioribacteraceae bacterium]